MCFTSDEGGGVETRTETEGETLNAGKAQL